MTPPMQSAQYAPPPQKANKTPVWIVIVIVVAVGIVLLTGVIMAIAIYGTGRYVASAKTAEAKNAVGSIARVAKYAYEREAAETGAHKLCRSATTVPATVPKGTKYTPSVATETDFNTGDAETGWRCLKFTMVEPIYYQYSYHQGSGYLASSASPPGPDGFEAAARGDLNGNGTTSLFALTGKVSGDTVVVSPSVYIENEFE